MSATNDDSLTSKQKKNTVCTSNGYLQEPWMKGIIFIITVFSLPKIELKFW